LDAARLREDVQALLSKHNGRVWLFGERPEEACDNGMALFRYVRTNYPEIGAYYVVSNKKRFKGDTLLYEHMVEHASQDHKNTFFAATILLSTHGRGYIEPWTHKILRIVYPAYKLKLFVFLQHGVIYSDLREKLGKKQSPVDLFISGAKPEYDYLLETLDFSKEELRYTGLARYDALHDFKTQNYILLMPTWRQYLAHHTREQFIQSEYFKHYNTLLHSPALHDYLTRNDLKLLFYPHFEMQKFIDCFTTDSSYIIIVRKGDKSVPDLLREAKLLITDSSSVFFDFAYMRKPIVYFQFDRAEFNARHYRQGYFDFAEHGFGSVVKTVSEVVQAVEVIAEQGFVLTEPYRTRAENFFPLHDRQNCKRIFDAVIALEQRNEK